MEWARAGRAAWVILAAATIVLLTLWMTVERSPAPDPVEPPPLVLSPGACPFEGCQYGTWIAREPIQLYSSPDGTPLDTPLPALSEVTALTGEIHAKPHRAVVTRAYSSDEQQGLRVGEVVYPLYPLGEGAMAVWHRGAIKAGSLDLAYQYSEAGAQPEWVWWVQVRLENGDTRKGDTAWMRNPRNLSGMDARE